MKPEFHICFISAENVRDNCRWLSASPHLVGEIHSHRTADWNPHTAIANLQDGPFQVAALRNPHDFDRQRRLPDADHPVRMPVSVNGRSKPVLPHFA